MGDHTPLASSLHRLRSLLARVKIQVEIAHEDRCPPDPGLVAAAREAVEVLARVEECALGIAPAHSRRVLVLEDDPLAGDLLARRLRRCGLQAAPGALPLPEVPADAVLIVDLSAMDRADARSREAVARSRPIVLTGAVGPSALARARALGARACLTKPAHMDQILDALRAAGEAPP